MYSVPGSVIMCAYDGTTLIVCNCTDSGMYSVQQPYYRNIVHFTVTAAVRVIVIVHFLYSQLSLDETKLIYIWLLNYSLLTY